MDVLICGNDPLTMNMYVNTSCHTLEISCNFIYQSHLNKSEKNVKNNTIKAIVNDLDQRVSLPLPLSMGEKCNMMGKIFGLRMMGPCLLEGGITVCPTLAAF